MSQNLTITAKSILSQLDLVRKDRNEKVLRDVFQSLQKLEDAIMNPQGNGNLQDPEIYGNNPFQLFSCFVQ
jgi:hypothetical protein